MRQKIAIIVINFSGTSDTLECFDSLLQVQSSHDPAVYVVHFAKNKGLKKIQDHSIQARVIVQDENLGFAGMNNVGIKKAIEDGASSIVLLNNDTTVDDNFLDPLIDALSDDSVGMASPKIYFAAGHEFHTGYEKDQSGKVIWYGGGMIDWQNMLTFHQFVDEVDRGQISKACETDFATGCCLAFRSTLIDQIGYMREDYFMYLEDVAWSVKVHKVGLTNKIEPASIIWHKNASSSGGSGSQIHQYYQTRNRILFAKEYAPLQTKLAVMKQALGQWRGKT